VTDFLATHPPVFADVTDPLEVDSWLCTTESKFGLHCTKYQKTLYTAQQLRGAAGAWWASYIATLPDDLPGMPPERLIEFKIEIQPGTTSIGRAPYKMSPVQMKELKIQRQGLLDKGYIRPRTSPWGCSVLFLEKKDKELHFRVD
jgi:hypothetical protein